ncbi:hypothetical protein [Roseovarius sp. D0-M9]|uniref:hypothetical protein n=1 Tax=Roseovarius sp. D0-M9 TaxID=3127117 RepID=UPI00300FCD66
MNKITVGVVAALIAVAVLSAMMLAMGVMPDLDVIVMFSAMMGTSAATGWLGHLIIGRSFVVADVRCFSA